MDFATYFDTKVVGEGLPAFTPNRDHPLSDPNRPSYAPNVEAGRSLMLHLERALTAAPPIRNPTWMALVAEAQGIREEQRIENFPVRVDEGSLSTTAVEKLVFHTKARDAYFAELDATAAPGARDRAREMAVATAMRVAFEPEGPRLAAGADHATRLAYNYQATLWNLAQTAKAEARDKNEEIQRGNLGAEGNERSPLVDPRRTVEVWTASMPLDDRSREDRWTNDYIVAMQTNEESIVMRGYMDIAMRSVVTGKVPTQAELAADIAALNDRLSRPVVTQVAHRNSLSRWDEEVLRNERETVEDQARRIVDERMARAGREREERIARGETVPPLTEVNVDAERLNVAKAIRDQYLREPLLVHKADGKVAGSDEISMHAFGGKAPKGRGRLGAVSKTRSKQIVVQPAITGRTGLYRDSVVTDRGISQAEAVTALQTKSRVWGVEGQGYFKDADVIAGRLSQLTAPKQGRQGAVLVSHAPEGTEFRDAVLQAAEKAKVEVVRGIIHVSSVNTITQSNRTRTHVDGAYSEEARRGRDLRIEAKVHFDPKATGVKDGVDFTNGATQKDLAGKMVMWEVSAPKGLLTDRQRATILTNRAAFTPRYLAAFGNERNSADLYQILQRRQLSGRSQSFVVTKGNTRARTVDVNAQIAARTQTTGERRRDFVMATRDWSTKSSAGMMLAGMAMPKHVAARLQEFPTFGRALDAAAAALKNPKGIDEMVAREGFSKPALRAALEFQQRGQDSEDFRRKVKSVTQLEENAKEARVDVLSDPREPMLARAPAMTGFSSPAARDAAKGSRIAIIGDEAPVSPALAGNIEKAMAGLAEKYGRDENGVAKMRVTTTLTPGVGEAVMDAALKLRIPVEAIGFKDDRRFLKGTDDYRLLGKAVDLNNEDLGGTWSLHTYGEREAQRSVAQATRVAMEGSDAVVVARLRSNDPRTLAAASAGQDRAIVVLGASDPDRSAYGGNHLLSQPDRDLTIAWGRDKGSPMSIAEHAMVSKGDDHTKLYATVSTGAGATTLASLDSISIVKLGAEGEMKLSLKGAEKPINDEKVRWDVIEKIDISRLSERSYADKLKLGMAEAAYVRRAHEDYTLNYASRVFSAPTTVRETLESKYRLTPPREKTGGRRVEEGLGV